MSGVNRITSASLVSRSLNKNKLMKKDITKVRGIVAECAFCQKEATRLMNIADDIKDEVGYVEKVCEDCYQRILKNNE